jgi:hypothetical protein
VAASEISLESRSDTSIDCDKKRQNLKRKFEYFRVNHPELTEPEMQERRTMFQQTLNNLECDDQDKSTSQQSSQPIGPAHSVKKQPLTKDELQEKALRRSGALGIEPDNNTVGLGIPRPGRFRFRDKHGVIWGSQRALEVANEGYAQGGGRPPPEHEVWATAELLSPGRWGIFSLNDAECSLNDAECSLNECSLNDAECSLNDAECSLNDAECSLNDAECSLNDAECSLNDTEWGTGGDACYGRRGTRRTPPPS